MNSLKIEGLGNMFTSHQNTPVIFRDYQLEAIERSLERLHQDGSTLGVAPTGSGKTLILSKVLSDFSKNKTSKVLVLQERDEILAQNIEKLKLISPNERISIVNAKTKDFSGDVVFAMVPTLVRHLEKLPRFDLLVLDECHHVAAKSYVKIIKKLRKGNSNLKIFGVTATPNRGDKKKLSIFNSIAFNIEIVKLISEGYLVRPRTFIKDIGITKASLEYLDKNKKVAESKFDEFTSNLLINSNSSVDINEVVKHWKEIADGRQTVFFTPSNKVSERLAQCFVENGINARAITHKFSRKERKELLDEFATGNVKILCNTQMLCEGWDCPIVSCIGILKTSSFKSTYLQMIGRGLRPYSDKSDCVILDFGGSSQLHGTLEQRVRLAKNTDDECYVKKCPDCGAIIAKIDTICAHCGHEFTSQEDEKEEDEELGKEGFKNFGMVEFDFLGQSLFVFQPLREDLWCINGFDRFCFIKKCPNSPNWISVGGIKHSEGSNQLELKITGFGERIDCFKNSEAFMFASNNFSMIKEKEWLYRPVSDKQTNLLNTHGISVDYKMNQYTASCWITYITYRYKIQKFVQESMSQRQT
jgi:superfamily II DNA or RNA helicase